MAKMTDYIEEYIADNLRHSRLLEESDVTFMYADLSPETEDGVPIRKLFISNLAERTTYKDLTKLFSQYGNVERCFLRRNQGKSNYAFVTFNSVDAAVRARFEEIRLHNRNLRVMPADSWHQPDSIENQYYNTKEWQKSDKKQSSEMSNEEYLQNDITDISIQTLNDDCLMHIFLQLPIMDRIRMERVCKRWRAVSQESWRSVKKLDLSCSMWGFYPHIKQVEVINTSTLRKVLLRCGRFLNEIDMSQLRYKLSQSTLTIAGKLCPNLQRVNVTGLVVSASGINSLTDNCHDITKFSLGHTKDTCDIYLQRLFKVNQKLQYFKVVFGQIHGKCLLHLPLETMEEIVLDSCTTLREDCLAQAIAKLRNLKSLTIHKCIDISDNVIQSIGTYCTNLKTLELSNIPDLMHSNDMIHITQLSNLEVLKLSMNSVVTDELLRNLSSKCQQLTYIDISDCFCVTNFGVAAIATLPKLEVLIMDRLRQVTDTNLRDMNSLKKLSCRCCQFTDQTMIELIGSAPQLEFLDLSRSHYITELTLKKAAAVTVNRTNNTILKIFVGGSSVCLGNFDEVSPFLQIVNVNLPSDNNLCV